MDEYYCPNCGATLNDQDGFDPDKGTWTCTDCGQRLMDDDIYYGDTFEGVEWRCDCCNALLNRQCGFSDSLGSWICTECGYTNGITEDDILDEGDIIRCPNCEGVLNHQFGFNGNDYDCECAFCGAKLHRDYFCDDFQIVEDDETADKEDKFECPHCGDKLNDQWGFDKSDDDWTCSSCGIKLHHSYSSDPYNVVDEHDVLKCPNCDAFLKTQLGYSEYDDDWECTECGAHLHHDYSSDPYELVDEDDSDDDSGATTYIPPNYTSRSDSSQRPYSDDDVKFSEKTHIKNKQRKAESELRKKRINAFFFKRKKINVQYDNCDLLGKDIDAVEILLYNQAFNNIKKIPIKDIYVDSPYRVGQVEQIVINGSSYFCVGDQIPYDAEIILTYHVKREITLPFNEKSLRRMNYIAAGDKLQKLGFTEIYERPINDLVMGWLKKDGSVEKITIGSIYPFKKHSVFAYDTKIVIEYHTYKKK